MKIVMTLLVRDEQDILRENIEFHLAHGVDEIVLMDNLSVDGTAEIAREYERAGCLHYLFQPRDDYSQARWVTAMARWAARELRADWVINSDVDEFWLPERRSLQDVFASVDPRVIAVGAPRMNFVARADDGRPFWRRMDVRRVTSRNVMGQPLLGKVAHRARADVEVVQGNHGVTIGGAIIPQLRGPITILHFPVRSRKQYLNKIVNGGSAYARNTELPASVGETWRYLYQLHLAGRFEEAIATELFSEDRILEGLATGALVRDDRLIAALTARVSERLTA
ncbi:MAG TPA: glycosyltransferase family 2 protein [Vicinamibacterales bacterium]|nr:glycosyltransferase family 2 protein [Vicinamibacterales bacterium]